MACVTTFDVVARKFGVQLPYTKLQELEWHFHAAIFSLWMGYCYTINAHPRVDSIPRGQVVSHPRVGRAGRLPAAGAALCHAGRLLQPGLRRRLLRGQRAVGQHRRPDAPLGHQGHLRFRPLARGARHPERAAAGHRVPVRRQVERGSQPADRPCRGGHLVRRRGTIMLDWLADYLSLIMFLSMFFFIFMGYPVAFIMGGLALIFAAGRRLSGRLQPHRHLRHRAAHVGRRRRRPGARLDSHVHLHGRHPGAIGIGQGHAGRHRAPDEMVPRRACRLRHGHGHHPGRADRRGRRRRDHPVGDRAAADDEGGLQQATRHRHHRVRRHARHPDPAGDHAGGDGRDAGDVGRQPVPGRDHAGLRAVRPLHRLHHRRRDPEAGHGARSCRRISGRRPAPRSGTRCGVACSR